MRPGQRSGPGCVGVIAAPLESQVPAYLLTTGGLLLASRLMAGRGQTTVSAGCGPGLTEFAWENIVQLTEPGQYWLDLGAQKEYAKGLKHEGDHTLEWKIRLEKDFGKLVVVANPIFEQGFSDSDDSGVEFEYAWGTYYRLNPAFEPGFEAYGGIGELTAAKDLNAQEHLIGPAARGTVLLGGGTKLKYNLGYLLGLADEMPDGVFKFELEYEFRFQGLQPAALVRQRRIPNPWSQSSPARARESAADDVLAVQTPARHSRRTPRRFESARR